MTLTQAVATPLERQRAVSPATPIPSAAFSVALGILLSLAFSWPRIVTIWQTGTFFDTDDAMRLVQVRAWLAGQSWFDLTAYRMDPPAGVFMHWSRVVDVPLALLIRAFELFVPADTAERLTRIAYPLLMQAAVLAALARTGRLLAGPRAVLPAMLLMVFSGYMFGQFQPGRIDHDSLQIMFLVLMLNAILAALAPGGWKSALLAPFFAAGGLAIGLENLPFVIIMGAVLPIGWILRDAAMRPQLLGFAAGSAVALPLAFVSTIGPARYGIVSCDAFSIVHLSAGLGGALACLLFGCLAGRRLGIVGRAAVAVAAGVVLIGALARAYPACLGDPYAGLDPLLRTMWLDNITEARPLLKLLALQPTAFPMIVLPVLFGAAAAGYAAWRETGLSRARWCVVIVFIAAGIAACFWEIRASTTLAPIVLLGGVYVGARLLASAAGRLRTALAFLALAPFTSMAWALVMPADPNNPDVVMQSEAAVCRAAGAYRALATLPPGLVFAPIDAGSHILVHTDDSVLGAPYFHNDAGNRAVIEGFLDKPDAARALIEATGARYLALCPGQVQMTVIAKQAPDGLAATLLAGKIPAWLTPVPLEQTPYKVFEIH